MLHGVHLCDLRALKLNHDSLPGSDLTVVRHVYLAA